MPRLLRLVALALLSGLLASALIVGARWSLAGDDSPVVGDVNGDGRSNVLDAELILQLDAGIILSLPPTATPHPTPTPPATATIMPTPTRTPARGGDRSTLLVPDDLLITHTGCSTRGDPTACAGGATVAFYQPGLHEVVMRGYNEFIEMFEVCHAHSEMTTNALGLPFWEWPSTEEGSSFILAVSQETGPWGAQDIQTLQVWTDNMFGGMCANYFVHPDSLALLAPVTYAWFREHLP